MEHEQNTFIRQEEIIEIEKNSRGYNWHIKIKAIPTTKLNADGTKTELEESWLSETDIDRMVRLNDEMMKKFGSMTA